MSVIATSALTAGLRSTFNTTYDQYYKPQMQRLSSWVQEVGSDKRTELYAYYKTAPHAKRWDDGNEVELGGFDSVQFSATNVRWQAGVEWGQDDRADDQIGKLFDRAKQSGQHLALLPERIKNQIQLAATDASLLASINNAPDGLALYSGSSRFGDANGNIYTGSGVATTSAVYADFFAAVAKFHGFQDTEGQPLLDPSMLDDYLIEFNPTYLATFTEAFKTERILKIVQDVSATDNVAATTPSSAIASTGFSIELYPNVRITDADWFIVAKKSPVKPIIWQLREDRSEAMGVNENSDYARRSNQEYIRWKTRAIAVPNLPFGTIKVNN